MPTASSAVVGTRGTSPSSRGAGLLPATEGGERDASGQEGEGEPQFHQASGAGSGYEVAAEEADIHRCRTGRLGPKNYKVSWR